jgi:hypothetical protein
MRMWLELRSSERVSTSLEQGILNRVLAIFAKDSALLLKPLTQTSIIQNSPSHKVLRYKISQLVLPRQLQSLLKIKMNAAKILLWHVLITQPIDLFLDDNDWSQWWKNQIALQATISFWMFWPSSSPMTSSMKDSFEAVRPVPKTPALMRQMNHGQVCRWLP